MKKIHIYIMLVVLVAFTACTDDIDDILDKKPLDVITDEDVWKSPELVKTYINAIYANMGILYMDNEKYFPAKGPAAITEILSIADEGCEDWGGRINQIPKYGNMTETSKWMSWWGYDQIYQMNLLIDKLPEEPGLTDEEKAAAISETRFLRAYSYFHMAKLFGGVPLITKPQSIDDPEEELYPARNKEVEIYDFVLSELDAIVNDLPETVHAAEHGRPTQNTALALKSRAAMYAASIAQYGTVNLDGVVGIPSSKANSYWQASYDASKKIMEYSAANSGNLALYNQIPDDKAQNYRQLFLDQRNVEIIWARSFLGQPGASEGPMGLWNLAQSPRSLHPWVGGQACAVYLEMADAYENADGTPGKLDPASLENGLVTVDELFGNKEPRFFGALYTQNTDFYGRTVQMYDGIIDLEGNLITSGNYKGLNVQPAKNKINGFGVLKYCDGSRWPQSTDMITFRYGEILLNHAEAAFELGKAPEALDAVNQIRERAGVPVHTEIDMDKIRHERKIELAFEGQRYWDLRRWRIAKTELTKTYSTLRFILDYASYEADPTNPKFQVSILPSDGGRTPVFNEENYYFPITPGRIANNGNLVENPGYE